MVRRLRIQQRQRQRLNQSRRRAFIDRQMLIIMSTSISLFLCTQIPSSLYNIFLSSFLIYTLPLTQALDFTTLFTFIASINFGVCILSSI